MLKGFAQALRPLGTWGVTVGCDRVALEHVLRKSAPCRWGMYAHDIMTIKDKQHAMACWRFLGVQLTFVNMCQSMFMF